MKIVKNIFKWGCLALILISISMLMKGRQAEESISDTEAFIYEPLNTPAEFAAPVVVEEPVQYINSVKGHKEEKYIYGSFLKGREDTLYVEETNEEYMFKVVSSNPNIPVLKLKYTIGPSLVNEGDLDGNATTEVGILDTWHTSSCRLYRIYTLKNNKWYYLVAPLETSESVRGSGVELAESTGIKNKVRVRYADFEAPLSSCASSPIKDTIVTVSFLPLD